MMSLTLKNEIDKTYIRACSQLTNQVSPRIRGRVWGATQCPPEKILIIEFFDAVHDKSIERLNE